MEIIFWLIVIFFWLFSFLLKKTKPLPPKEEPQEAQKDLGEILLETLGFPPSPKPKPLKEIKPKIEKVPIREEVKIEKPPLLEKKEEVLVEEKEELLISSDRLEEGIVLSTILGPPKSLSANAFWRTYSIRRSGEIGIHV